MGPYLLPPMVAARSKLSQKLATPVSAAAQVAILQATAASAMTTAASESDYTFDKATGYYRHKTTGILYDANTGLFFNAITNAWYSWNETTREYTQVGSKSVVESPPKEETERRPVVATLSSAPKPEPSVLKDVKVVMSYRDRAKERRKLHREGVALDRLVSGEPAASAVKGRDPGAGAGAGPAQRARALQELQRGQHGARLVRAVVHLHGGPRAHAQRGQVALEPPQDSRRRGAPRSGRRFF